MENNQQKRTDVPIFDQNGLLLVNKPVGWTSNDVVAFIRARFRAAKVGHCGTLDPAATGLLLVVFGKFTKFSQLFSCEEKAYEATALLGTITDSLDMDGQILEQNDWSHLTVDKVKEAFLSLLGDSMQIPPMVSAIKVDGKKLYQLARKGIEIEREAKPITVYSISFGKIELPYVDFTVSCSKGTYVRSLAADAGAKLGCGASLCRLNRIRSGDFDLADAHTLDEIKTWSHDDLSKVLKNYLFNKLSMMERYLF